ncbi:ABC transporter permease [Oceanitalea stevensii]|uniref:ABC transporter permease n=1 Tax=Oceanitalea stevensii TaxID=2763072 RepID=A0ABR8Z1W8_9MICO|nr:ABC transporter permease [Oceanitalea stevensii]MBD8061951.1 ABC transporter permease [Oceanitalea stevensii]
MTATATRVPSTATTHDLSLLGVLHGEWVKLLSLRSTWWMVAVTAVTMTLLAVGVAPTADELVAYGAETGAEAHGAELVVVGFQVGMVTLAVLGALLMTGEYGTGMARSTFAAVPTRLPVLAAKGTALAALTVLTTALSLVTATLASAPALSEHGLVPRLDQAHTWQAFGGVAFFFVAVALIALGLAAVVRHTAGTITAVLGLLLLVPGVLQLVAVDWVQDLVSLMPVPAAVAFIGTSGLMWTNELLSPWQGVAVVTGYAVLAIVAGAVALRRRDV